MIPGHGRPDVKFSSLGSDGSPACTARQGAIA